MRFTELAVSGVYAIEHDTYEDERGSFTRTFCRDEFAQHGLEGTFLQCATARNPLAGTLRGMHFQRAPYAETKLVRCVSGRVYDVVIDLRPTSRTYLQWAGIVLRPEQNQSLYVPAGCAHGYLTLEADSILTYQLSQRHAPDYASGVRWDDPAFGVRWPQPVRVISARDRGFPDYAR